MVVILLQTILSQSVTVMTVIAMTPQFYRMAMVIHAKVAQLA